MDRVQCGIGSGYSRGGDMSASGLIKVKFWNALSPDCVDMEGGCYVKYVMIFLYYKYKAVG